MKSTITLSIDNHLKKQAEEILENMGLSLTVYLTSSLRELVSEKKTQFELLILHKDNDDYMTKLDSAIEDAKEHGVYEYLGKDEYGKAIFNDVPQKATI